MSLLKQFARTIKSTTIVLAIATTPLFAASAAHADDVFVDPNRLPRPHLVLIKRPGGGLTALCRRNADKTNLIITVINDGNAASKRHTFRVTFIRSNNLVTSLSRALPVINPGSRVSFHTPIPKHLVKNRFNFKIIHIIHPTSVDGGLCLP
ncbi:hypothetical protein ACFYE9_11885 [Rhizobium leguminosarum]|uniref:Copper chaperone PCu(A)C n=2 Tax=Rhizobium leguminosarum TaxID=384 RepID=A0A154I8W3_RHILE|nr:hypothetical protein [Rhizobium leguminosarum]KZA97040.1 hypothetical protein A4A59_33190 [Rhizobium leguminosarum]